MRIWWQGGAFLGSETKEELKMLESFYRILENNLKFGDDTLDFGVPIPLTDRDDK